MFRFLVFGFLGISLLAISGCTTAAVAVLDEKVSQMMDQDCTTFNIMLGDSYCREKRKAIKQEEVYCYRTLGGVDCYNKKTPYTAESLRVRDVSELGSLGAKVEYVSEKSENQSIFKWPFSAAKVETAEVD